MRIKYDTHLHTSFSLDSETPVSEQVRQAKKLGMNGICITDHIDYDFPSDQCPGVTIVPFLFDMNEYKDTFRSGDYGPDSPEVLIGVECGLQNTASVLEKNRKLCSDPELDQIIGSIHLIDGKDPYFEMFWKDKDQKKMLWHYFELTLENIMLFSDFNILGHIDYAARYVPDKSAYVPTDYFEITDEIMKTLIKKNIALEINTSPLKKGYGYTNPHPDLIKRYYELGGRLISIGSDAHTPDALGFGFEETADFLIETGFSEYATFVRKQPVSHPL